MEFGSAAACIVISSHSCSDAMPTTEQVYDYIERCKRGEITALNNPKGERQNDNNIEKLDRRRMGGCCNL